MVNAGEFFDQYTHKYNSTRTSKGFQITIICTPINRKTWPKQHDYRN